MAHAQTQKTTYEIPAGTLWASLWKAALVVALVGGVVTAITYSTDTRRFAFSYLFSFLVFLVLGLGSLFFILIQHLTGAGWSASVRRIPEFLASALPIMALLFIPVWFNAKQLYPWLEHSQHDKAAQHKSLHNVKQHVAKAATSHEGHHTDANDANKAAHHGAAHNTPEHQAHAETLAKKASYLNLSRFTIYAIAYFFVWLALSRFFVRKSFEQDQSRDVKLTLQMQKWAPVSTFLLALSLTFAAFDWVMSLEPNWYSTIFGVYIFASSMVAVLSITIVIALSLGKAGLVGEAINIEHFHDLGKLLFGFLVFWAYIAFSQLLLIWYAGIPEEATYYHLRWDSSGWRNYSLFLLIAKFVVPFALLLSRNTKRNTLSLGIGAAWLAFMHVVDMYWFVLPYYKPNVFSFHTLDVSCLFLVGGLYFAVVFYQMQRHSLIAVGDPRLERALHFHT